jgi:cystathionine beta-synthase
VRDRDSFDASRRLVRTEGILAGGSSGTALAAALAYAGRVRPGAVVVALLPDTGRNYLSKFHSDEWMKKNGFMEEAS